MSKNEEKGEARLKVERDPQTFSGALDLPPDSAAVAFGKDLLALSADVALLPFTSPYAWYKGFRKDKGTPLFSLFMTTVLEVVSIGSSLVPAFVAAAMDVVSPAEPHRVVKDMAMAFIGTHYLVSAIFGLEFSETCFPRTLRRRANRKAQEDRKRPKRPSSGEASPPASRGGFSNRGETCERS